MDPLAVQVWPWPWNHCFECEIEFALCTRVDDGMSLRKESR